MLGGVIEEEDGLVSVTDDRLAGDVAVIGVEYWLKVMGPVSVRGLTVRMLVSVGSETTDTTFSDIVRR